MMGYTGASPALMAACARRDIGLTFLSGSGRFLARVSGEVRGNITLRKEQYRISMADEKSLGIARNCILGKVYNAKWILERACRDYPLRVDVEKIKRKSGFLSEALTKIKGCETAAELRGLEGEAAPALSSIHGTGRLDASCPYF